MQNILYKSAVATLSVFMLAACKPKLDAPSADKGSLDVSKYVAIGNSITSGFSDAALYYDGQLVSYPNLLATQFKLIGGGEFRQPLTPPASVGVGSSANAKLVLGYKTDCMGITSLSPKPAAAFGDISILTTNISAQGPFNNMGVPGAKSFHVPYAGYGTANPLFGRMTSNAASNSILGDAVAQNATFFSLFIGNNDALSYALTGGTSDSVTAPPVFNASIDGIVGAMSANGAKGVIGNVPDITNLPYFTTIPYNGLVLDASKAAALTAAYSPLGITFSVGNNPFIISDPAVPGGVRKIKPDELILLSTPQDSLKCAGWGSVKPLAGKYVLSSTEIAKIQNGTAAFNNKLKSVADAKGMAFVDVNAFMAACKKGIAYNGINITTTFVSGGAFSLDGIHLTPLGNAMLANEFIKSINAQYGSKIPQLDATKYHGVVFP